MDKLEQLNKIEYALKLRHAHHRNGPLGIRGHTPSIRKSNVDCAQCQAVEEALEIVKLLKGDCKCQYCHRLYLSNEFNCAQEPTKFCSKDCEGIYWRTI